MSTMGLAFCKMVVEAHGGRIWVDNEVDAGTTITFTLPPQTSPYHAVIVRDQHRYPRRPSHFSRRSTPSKVGIDILLFCDEMRKFIRYADDSIQLNKPPHTWQFAAGAPLSRRQQHDHRCLARPADGYRRKPAPFVAGGGYLWAVAPSSSSPAMARIARAKLSHLPGSCAEHCSS
jgi:hypothetical protein